MNPLRDLLVRLRRWLRKGPAELRNSEVRARFWSEVHEGESEAAAASKPEPPAPQA